MNYQPTPLAFGSRVNLPPTNPRGSPHLIDLRGAKRVLDENFDIPNLLAVDTIASTLYRWDRKALEYLLDKEIRKFHWGFLNGGGYEFYVVRRGRKAKVCTDLRVHETIG